MKKTGKWSIQIFKYLMLVLALFLGLFMVVLFSSVARGAELLVNFNPEAILNTDAPDANTVNLQVRKIATHDPVIAGTTLTYTISITNTGVTTATGVLVTDTLPTGVTLLNSNPGTPDCLSANNLVECSLPDLAVGANTLVTLTIQVQPTAIGTLTNNVAVGSVITESNPADNTTSLNTTVDAQADLVIQKTDIPDPVVAGELLTYTLTIDNNGPSDAASITVTDDLPKGVNFVSVVPGSPVCTRHARTITCNFNALAANSSTVVTLTVQLSDTVVGPINNTALLSSLTADPDMSNNSSTATTDVLYSADLHLMKTGSASLVQTGGTLTYTLQVTNTGPASVAGVLLTDTLPAEVNYQSYTTNRGTCAGGSTVSCQLGTFAPGDNALIDVVVVAGPVLGKITNTVVVTATALYDLDLSNNTASYTATITSTNQLVDLGVSLADDPDPVVAGKMLTYTIQVSNTGGLDASGVIVTDTLPAEVSLNSVASSQGSCNNQPVVVCNIGVVPAGNSTQITLTVDVSPPVQGLITNTVQVYGANPGITLLTQETTLVTPENVPPTVSWFLPVQDEEQMVVTHETILLVAQAADNVGIDHVKFYRWDVDLGDYVDIGIDFSPPYQSNLDPAILNNNDWNQIFVKSYDVSGNESLRKRIFLIKYWLLLPLVVR